jgi:ribose transport system ATP-binding protein
MLVVQREDAATACMIDIWQKGIYKKTIKNGLKTRRVCPAMPNIDSNDKALLLEMRAISKVFPGVRALDEVSLKLRQGEVLALVGENGAGKSTLIKILAGAYRADQGHILIDGQNCPIASPLAAQQAGISLIYQEFNLIPDLTVRENIFLGREKTRHGFISAAAESRQAQALFQKIGIQIDPEIPCRDITIAQQQIVEIAKALSLRARILVMDEPSATLTQQEVDHLFAVIRDLKAQGLGIIYISHRLDEVFAIADRVMVLRDGAHVRNQSIKETSRPALIEQMVGRSLEAEFPPHTCRVGPERLRVEGLSWGSSVQDVSFCAHAGEILGFAGLVGSGRTETMRLIFGADPQERGRIFVNGKEVSIRAPQDAIRQGICLLTEDRKGQGLVPMHSVLDNFSLPNLERFRRGPFLSQRQQRDEFNSYVDSLKIKISDPDQTAMTLSGGNQQKIVLAKWLARHTDIIIFDEPTRGIDVGAKYEIYCLMSALADAGKTIIMVSSELPEIIGMSDRILVMHEGRIRGEITDVAQTSQEAILSLAIGAKAACANS